MRAEAEGTPEALGGFAWVGRACGRAGGRTFVREEGGRRWFAGNAVSVLRSCTLLSLRKGVGNGR